MSDALYLLEIFEHGDSLHLGVFSTLEKAQSFASKHAGAQLSWEEESYQLAPDRAWHANGWADTNESHAWMYWIGIETLDPELNEDDYTYA
ncbi:hypothetical protein ACFRAQ_34505 [Nocardia sp. NPDC056611]|uniref:hypothetical protein n=1 Tax=Nocardia sp. NPDC056611 TaxID=3345877 RepID=UPI00366D868D